MLPTGSTAPDRDLVLGNTPSKTALLPRRIALVLLGSGLLALCSHIAVPRVFTPVPVTMQTFALFLLAGTLGPTLAMSAVCAYFLEGMLGMPVFAPPLSGGGLAHLFGPTGGYLLGYLPAVFLFSSLYNNLQARFGTFTSALLAATVAEVPVFLLGAAWLATWLHLSILPTLHLATTPFLLAEAAKISLVAAFITATARIRRSS